jgi:hypothetical protein
LKHALITLALKGRNPGVNWESLRSRFVPLCLART